MKTIALLFVIICIALSGCKPDTIPLNALYTGTYYGTVNGSIYNNCIFVGDTSMRDTFIVTPGAGQYDIIITSKSLSKASITGTINSQNVFVINTQNSYLDYQSATVSNWTPDSLSLIQNDSTLTNGTGALFAVSLATNGCHQNTFWFRGSMH